MNLILHSALFYTAAKNIVDRKTTHSNLVELGNDTRLTKPLYESLKFCSSSNDFYF